MNQRTCFGGDRMISNLPSFFFAWGTTNAEWIITSCSSGVLSSILASSRALPSVSRRLKQNMIIGRSFDDFSISTTRRTSVHPSVSRRCYTIYKSCSIFDWMSNFWLDTILNWFDSMRNWTGNATQFFSPAQRDTVSQSARTKYLLRQKST